jgi:hypothetical protein
MKNTIIKSKIELITIKEPPVTAVIYRANAYGEFSFKLVGKKIWHSPHFYNTREMCVLVVKAMLFDLAEVAQND